MSVHRLSRCTCTRDGHSLQLYMILPREFLVVEVLILLGGHLLDLQLPVLWLLFLVLARLWVGRETLDPRPKVCDACFEAG